MLTRGWRTHEGTGHGALTWASRGQHANEGTAHKRGDGMQMRGWHVNEGMGQRMRAQGTSTHACMHGSTPAFITYDPTVGGDGAFGGQTVPAPLVPSARSVPRQEHLKHARLAEDRKLEKEEPGEDGGEGTAEDCGGP